jgi:uncharacterized cupredoxin-like copper-binding protein
LKLLTTLLLFALPMTAGAHGDAVPAQKGLAPISTTQHEWGREGDPKLAARTIEIDMSDRMRFAPQALVVTVGETVRLRVRNRGRTPHELVLGTPAALGQHAELMKRHPGMEHDEPYMAHVAPGRRADIVWAFNREGEFMYGCLVPGHWEAGMQGTIRVAARRP